MDKTFVVILGALRFGSQIKTEVTLDIQYQNYVLLQVAVNDGNNILFGENKYLKSIEYVIPDRLLSIERYDATAWSNKYADAFMIKI